MKERHRPIPKGGWEALQRLGREKAIERFVSAAARLALWRQELWNDSAHITAAGRKLDADLRQALEDLEDWCAVIAMHGVGDPGRYWMLPAMPLRYLLDRSPKDDKPESRIIRVARGER